MKKTITINFLRSISFSLALLGAFNNLSAQSNPTPYNGWPTSYTFNNWPASSSAGTYPDNMIFHYADTNIVDPDLSRIIASDDYTLAYNLTAQSRIEGQGTHGFSFLNTNPGHSSDSTGNLGEAVLALNTTNRTNVQLSWTAGTLSSGRVYMLRAQYRVGNTGAYTDLPYTNLTDIEYTAASSADSTGTNFGPITLPSSCEDEAVVQIRWAYYYGGSGSGSRSKINLTNINVSSSSSTTGINGLSVKNTLSLYPNPISKGESIELNQYVSGTIIDIYGHTIDTISNSNIIATGNLSKGVYILQTDKRQTIRFVIQ